MICGIFTITDIPPPQLTELTVTIHALECWFCGAQEISESWERREAWTSVRQAAGWAMGNVRGDYSLRWFALCPTCNRIVVSEGWEGLCRKI
jgi:hypothetical protein